MAHLVPLDNHELEPVVQVFNLLADLVVGHKEVVTSRNVFHDVPLHLVILQDGHAVVDQDWRLSRFKVGPKFGKFYTLFSPKQLQGKVKLP